MAFTIMPLLGVAQKKAKQMPSIETGTVVFNFIPVVGDKAFFIDSIYVSPDGDLYKITNWKFFISNMALSSSFGEEKSATVDEKKAVLLIDFSINTRDNKPLLQVPVGAYTDVRFDVGLPRQVNHTDPTVAAPPLDLAQQDMYWEWNSGYIFLLVEGQLLNQQKDRFHFAIGGDNKIMPIAHGNLFNVTPLVTIEKNKVTTLSFTFDLNKLLKNGDGSNYSLKTAQSRIVHGGYFADILSMNAKQSITFKSVESVIKSLK